MKLLFILLTVFLIISFSWINENYALLSEEDFLVAHEDSKVSAISWPLDDETFLESFNKWQCYSADQLKLTEIKVVNNTNKCVAAIEVNLNGKTIQIFDTDDEEDWNCKKVLNDWKNLLTNQRSICLYGAFVQAEDSNILLWDLEKIKTENGYWNRAEEAQLLYSQDKEVLINN